MRSYICNVGRFLDPASDEQIMWMGIVSFNMVRFQSNAQWSKDMNTALPNLLPTPNSRLEGLFSYPEAMPDTDPTQPPCMHQDLVKQ